jgi:hypothetical protein
MVEDDETLRLVLWWQLLLLLLLSKHVRVGHLSGGMWVGCYLLLPFVCFLAWVLWFV